MRFALIPFALCLLAPAAHAQVQPVPPRDTTPWVPRDTLDGEVTHVVRRGDTLWDLAQHYLRDPFRWPEIFRRNTDVVEDPHWIYPGEVLRIPVADVRPDALRAAAEEGRVVPRVEPSLVPPAALPAPAPGPTVFSEGVRPRVTIGLEEIDRPARSLLRRGQVDAAPFVTGRRGPMGAGRIVGTAERPAIAMEITEYRFHLYDHAYIDLPDGVPAFVGDEFLVLAEGAEVTDTLRLMVPTGLLRVVEAPAGARPARAMLVRQFSEIMIGQLVVPYELPPALEELDLVPIAAGPTARVLWIHNDPVLPSLQHYVILSRVAGVEVRPGDRFTLIDQTRLGAADPESPPEDAALVQVVRVTPAAATAIVVAQKLPTISRGMHARLTARLR